MLYFQDEIERLRKESSRQLEEEVEAMQRLVQLELERERAGKPADDGNTHRLKLKWKRNGPNYDTESLTDIFSKVRVHFYYRMGV